MTSAGVAAGPGQNRLNVALERDELLAVASTHVNIGSYLPALSHDDDGGRAIANRRDDAGRANSAMAGSSLR